MGLWCIVATVAGCVEPGPSITLGYGTLSEDHEAMAAFGCGDEQRVVSTQLGATVLSPTQHSVSRRLTAGEALSVFDFDVTPTVTGDRSAALTLTASARVEDNVCGTGCEGTGARARFSWSGAVSLPPAAQGYSVRLAVHAERASSRGPGLFSGECAIETPWRPAVVIEVGDATRDFDAPAGDATIRVTCARAANRSFASIGCFGATHSGSPESQGLDSSVTVSLRVRMEFAPRAE